jgi:hypothetical protein
VTASEYLRYRLSNLIATPETSKTLKVKQLADDFQYIAVSFHPSKALFVANARQRAFESKAFVRTRQAIDFPDEYSCRSDCGLIRLQWREPRGNQVALTKLTMSASVVENRVRTLSFQRHLVRQ